MDSDKSLSMLMCTELMNEEPEDMGLWKDLCKKSTYDVAQRPVSKSTVDKLCDSPASTADGSTSGGSTTGSSTAMIQTRSKSKLCALCKNPSDCEDTQQLATLLYCLCEKEEHIDDAHRFTQFLQEISEELHEEDVDSAIKIIELSQMATIGTDTSGAVSNGCYNLCYEGDCRDSSYEGDCYDLSYNKIKRQYDSLDDFHNFVGVDSTLSTSTSSTSSLLFDVAVDFSDTMTMSEMSEMSEISEVDIDADFECYFDSDSYSDRDKTFIQLKRSKFE